MVGRSSAQSTNKRRLFPPSRRSGGLPGSVRVQHKLECVTLVEFRSYLVNFPAGIRPIGRLQPRDSLKKR